VRSDGVEKDRGCRSLGTVHVCHRNGAWIVPVVRCRREGVAERGMKNIRVPRTLKNGCKNAALHKSVQNQSIRKDVVGFPQVLTDQLELIHKQSLSASSRPSCPHIPQSRS